MTNHGITTSTRRPRAYALTTTLRPLPAQLPSHEEPTPPLSPPLILTFTLPASLPDAIHVFYLHTKHLSAHYASCIAASPHPRHSAQLWHFLSTSTQEYAQALENRLQGSVHAGLGLRILRDAVMRGRMLRVRWLGVGAGEIERRRVLVGGLEGRLRRLGKMGRCSEGRMRAVEAVEARAERKREGCMRRWWLVDGLMGKEEEEEDGRRESSWDFDVGASGGGLGSLEEEFRKVGEWPDGCAEGEGEPALEIGLEETRDEEERPRRDDLEGGWVVISKQGCERAWRQT